MVKKTEYVWRKVQMKCCIGGSGVWSAAGHMSPVLWTNTDGAAAACHCRGSKDTYVKYAAILNLLLSVSHAEQGRSTLLSLWCASCNMSVSLRGFYAKSSLNLLLLWTLWNHDWSGYKQTTGKKYFILDVLLLQTLLLFLLIARVQLNVTDRRHIVSWKATRAVGG